MPKGGAMRGKTQRPPAFLGEALPVAIAHRGGGEPAWENTFEAFSEALNLGFRIIETDLRLTADGKVVTYHDRSAKRVLGDDVPIRKLTLADLQRYAVRNSLTIPTLEEALAAWPSAKFNVDLKEWRVVEPFAKVIERAAAHERICVASFSDRRLVHARRLLGNRVAMSAGPRAVAQILARGARREGSRSSQFAAIQVPFRMLENERVRRYVLQAARRQRVQVHAWTVNDRTVMTELLEAGVDGIVSDALPALKDLMLRRGQWP
jgi:glycerophosphoryl diester phosphodiesterase